VPYAEHVEPLPPHLLAALPSVPVEVPLVWLELLLSPWMRVLAFAWGTIWGSFANVVIYRLPREESVVRPRSRCPACGHAIAGFDNLPIISYLLLRGRCRHCKAPFSPRYLMVELLAGMLSFATFMLAIYVPLLEGAPPGIAAWQLRFFFCLALLVVVFIDLDKWIIPDAIVLPMAAIGIVVAVIDPSILGVGWLPSIASAAGGWALFAGIRLLYLRTRGIEALGLGDAKLLVMVGAWTGPVGLAWCIGFGAVQGLVVAVPMTLLGRRIANTELHEAHGDDPELEEREGALLGKHVPFGPFLALAALEYALLGNHIDALFLGFLGS
jgi:leader peptidase (prepilin peptidase) / N-methyltransferase